MNKQGAKRGQKKSRAKKRNSKKQVSKRKSAGVQANSGQGKRKRAKKPISRTSTTRTKVRKPYKISKVERYYGDQKAYIFEAKNAKYNHIFSDVFSEKNQRDFTRLTLSLERKIKLSPLKYRNVNTIQLAVTGVASVTGRSTKDDSDDGNEFEFWKASVGALKNPTKKQFFQSLEARKTSLKRKLDDFISGEMEYAGESSSRAEEYYIKKMRVYVELPRNSSQTIAEGRKKQKAKNRRLRSGNKKNR